DFSRYPAARLLGRTWSGVERRPKGRLHREANPPLSLLAKTWEEAPNKARAIHIGIKFVHHLAAGDRGRTSRIHRPRSWRSRKFRCRARFRHEWRPGVDLTKLTRCRTHSY